MKWFEGSIADAITAAKQQRGIFVVYIEGTDEASSVLTQVLNKEAISSQLSTSSFVAIRLTQNSAEHNQFVEIYKLVPVPSVFYIADTGHPVAVVAGTTNVGDVEKKVTDAINRCVEYLSGVSAENQAGASSSGDGQLTADTNITDKAEPSTSSNAAAAMENVQQEQSQMPQATTAPLEPSIEEKVEKAKQLIMLKNKEKRALEVEKEKEAELERRRVGHEMQSAKLKKQELELQQLKEEREKAKREASEAKKRVLDQIAQDKAERLQRNNMSTLPSTPVEPEVTQPRITSASSSSNPNIARLQFKLPSGETKAHSFQADTTLAQVRQFIDNNIVLPFQDYQMATTFPRREFTHTDNDLDLRSLQLLPSAVILILPLNGRLVAANYRPGVVDASIQFFWSAVSPLLNLGQYIRSLIFGGPPPVARDERISSTRPTASRANPRNSAYLGGTTVVRKRGNIHTLADANDGNDDNNTWNGNSTQQM